MSLKLAYCDYIAHLIKKHIADADKRDKHLLDTVGSIRFDLSPQGAMLSSKKRISVVDIQGKSYTITIEENDSGSTV
jgi:hypothetical protein